MRPAEENKSFSTPSDDYEILSEVYLDTLLKVRPVIGVAIHQQTIGGSKQLASRGVFPNKNAQTEPVHFGTKPVGSFHIELNQNDTLNAADQKIFAYWAAQLAPILAWSTPDWMPRLKALRLLYRLKQKNTDFDWVGIYRNDSLLSDTLTLSMYMGEPTEHIHIPISTGICGAAVREERVINVPHVKADPRFIACSVRTQSELVVPIRNSQGKVVAEIDIDSNKIDYFSEERIADTEACAQKIEAIEGLFD